VRGFEIDWCCDIVVERVFPARDANAPFVAGFEPGKAPFRMWGDQIVPVEHGKIEKFARHLYADRMQAEVFRAGAAKPIAKKSGHRIAATTFQFRSEDIRGHRLRLARECCAVKALNRQIGQP
jgi:hypothetical protein